MMSALKIHESCNFGVVTITVKISDTVEVEILARVKFSVLS